MTPPCVIAAAPKPRLGCRCGGLTCCGDHPICGIGESTAGGVGKPNDPIGGDIARGGQVDAQPDAAAVSQACDQVRDQLAHSFPKIGPLMDEAETEVLAFTAFPRQHCSKVLSTNPIERIQTAEDWQVSDRRYLSETSMALLQPASDTGPIAAIPRRSRHR